MPRRPRVSSSDLSVLAPLAVARVADLIALGVPSSTIAHRVRTGRWRQIFPGVIALQSGALSREQEIAAAMLYCGDGAVLTGADAARRHGLHRAQATALHVLVPEDRRRRCLPALVVERSSRRESVVRDGVVVAPLERCVLDHVRRLGVRDDVVAALAEAVQRRRTTVDRLARELAAGNRRGSAIPREVLEEVADGVRSVAEGWGRRLIAGTDIGPMLWNPRLHRPDGSFLASPDAYDERIGLAWEHHSTLFHPPEREDDDARRMADMVEAGVVVVSHRPRRLLTEPQRVLDELRSYRDLATARPCPDLIVRSAA